MLKNLTLLLVLFAISGISTAQDLPKYMTQEELEFLKTYKRPPVLETDDNNPPPGPVRTMAEWEELQALQITWVSTASHRVILRSIVDHAQEECLVYIICGTSGGNDSNSIKTYLTAGSVPHTNVRFLTTPSNSIWCRDYGPWTVYSNVIDTMRIVDWIYNRVSRPQDDATPVFIANYMGVPIHRTLQSPNDLVNTGGNFMVDGHGTGFASKLILTENQAGNPYGVSTKNESQIDGIMSSYMGLNRYIKMNTLPYDQIHHIDMHIKLLDEETLLVGQYPPGVADGPQIEANLQYVLSNFQSCFGKPYKVVRIPMPPHNGNYPPTGNYRTYTNSVFVNKTVIVPTYETQYDTTALRIYREALPGYKIYGINSNNIIGSLGAIHCITKEIGVSEPVFISHSAIRDNNNTSSPYQVKAYVKSKTGISNARVFWRTDTTQAYNQVNMSVAADTFTANIPAQSLGTTVYYYISATSVSNRTVTKPLTAPNGYIKFYVDNTTGITGNTGNIHGFQLAQNYPNPFNPETEINFTLPENNFVTLKVYDVSGRLIKELVNDFRTAGNYSVNFNASGIPSGIYFYKLESGSFTDVKKMILVK